jgi:hypothetical protein
MNASFDAYITQVLEYLETLDYPDMIQEFDEGDVALSMSGAMQSCYTRQMSYRMCALIIWSATLQYQIMPRTTNVVKH